MMLTLSQRKAWPTLVLARCLTTCLLALTLATALATGIAPARADDAACRPIRMVGIAVLKQCGDQVRSMTLSLHDIKRTPGAHASGRFLYLCPLQHMCEDEPDLWGFFIDQAAWLAGERDEAAIRELLRHAPGLGAVPDDFATSTCPVSTVEIAGLDGRAGCFELAPGNVQAVVIVGAADDIGFVLVFAQRGLSGELLRDKVSAITPKFVLQRAAGDAGLMKWLR